MRCEASSEMVHHSERERVDDGLAIGIEAAACPFL